jgi:hypothetical protein
MIFDDSAGESQSIKLRASGRGSALATSGSSGFRGRRGRLTAPGSPARYDPPITNCSTAHHRVEMSGTPTSPACDGQGVGRLRLRLIAALGSILPRLITVKQDQVKMDP